jgi:hypothetical protein
VREKLAVWIMLLGIGVALYGLALIPANRANNSELDYNHDYAGKILLRIEEMSQEVNILYRQSPQEALNYYTEAAAAFNTLKQASVHFKGQFAADFAHAFAQAEDWCRYSAQAIEEGGNEVKRHQANESLLRAKAEFKELTVKNYK